MYNKLSFEEFGAHLLKSGDLDPVYIALNGCGFDEGTRNRWLTAYCAFYSTGFASWASEREGHAFWNGLMEAAVNDTPAPCGGRWPRASERRHFRGGQAVKAIEEWQHTYGDSPEDMMADIASAAPSFEGVLREAQNHRSVGTWMGFKLVDLVDACMDKDIDQSDISMFIYDTPKKSMLRLWREKMGYPESVKPKDERVVLEAMIEYAKEAFKEFTIPHKPGKPVDLFTLETCFCKHASHLNGHYPLYNDIDEINHGLQGWIPSNSNAKLFYEKMPKHV